ncbi:hypothetical protein TYRP_005210 [Tyrophagus putrescentiae]|nr:hypothetical protein TYRP_005210 [Tyrophagus putrescentiae]
MFLVSRLRQFSTTSMMERKMTFRRSVHITDMPSVEEPSKKASKASCSAWVQSAIVFIIRFLKINLLPPHRVGGHRVKVPVQLNGISVDLRFVAVGAAAKDEKLET